MGVLRIIFNLLLVFASVSCADKKGPQENPSFYEREEVISKTPDSVMLPDHSDSSIESTVNIEYLKRSIYKLGHHINTSENEARPVLSNDGNTLYFTGLDRTGFFDFKIDFIEAESAGGEDIFYSKKDLYGQWNDARPIDFLNTNRHESLSSIYGDEFYLTANYKENLGRIDEDGVNTSDIFIAKRLSDTEFQIIHLDEPVNSLFTEADPFKYDEQTMLFVSDRPENIGPYHKKGWKWNDSFWGNTDVWVSFFDNGYWTNPLNLGEKINTPYAERTPFLTPDGLTLYLSSNGYENSDRSLNVYKFTRTDKNDWENWSGPIKIADISTLADEFGYVLDDENNAYFTRAEKLTFKRTNPYNRGDAGIVETNYRSGYKIYGLQTHSYNGSYQTDIFQATTNNYDFLIPDICFEFDSATILPNTTDVLDKLIDFLKQNTPKSVLITGYTDNQGNEFYNQELSEKRALSVKQYIDANTRNNFEIATAGGGQSNPLNDNATAEKRAKNRRVEIKLIH